MARNTSTRGRGSGCEKIARNRLMSGASDFGSTSPTGDVTQLLRAWSEGDSEALKELMPLVYGELRRRAVAQMRQERAGHTLQPTALVHEAYLKLVNQKGIQ